MAFYTDLEKQLSLLDRQRRALERRQKAATATALDLLLNHGQQLGPTARRAGLTPYALRKALHATPEIAAIVQGDTDRSGSGEAV